MTSPTSLNALESAKRRAPTLRQRVLHAIQSMQTGATDEEISLFTRIPLNTVRPRRGELVAEGLVVEGGTRRTSTNHEAITWRLATAEEREAFEATKHDREVAQLSQAVEDAYRNYKALHMRWLEALCADVKKAEVSR